MNDTVADRDAEIAMIMAMGRATVKEASQALDENDGDVDLAMAQLYGMTPQYETISSSRAKSSRLRKQEDIDDEEILKPPARPTQLHADASKEAGA